MLLLLLIQCDSQCVYGILRYSLRGEEQPKTHLKPIIESIVIDLTTGFSAKLKRRLKYKLRRRLKCKLRRKLKCKLRRRLKCKLRRKLKCKLRRRLKCKLKARRTYERGTICVNYTPTLLTGAEAMSSSVYFDGLLLHFTLIWIY